MKAFAEIKTRAMKRIHQRGFHEARFINRAAWSVIRARRPLDHPVKDFELAELREPRRDTFSAQIIHKRLLAGARTHSQQGTQFLIEQIPFLLESIKSALRFFLGGLFQGEVVFFREFL